MNQILLEEIKKSAKLPSLPAVAIRVLELARRDDASMGDMGKVISADPALCAKLLRTVNSGFYALPEPVATVSHALVILGLNSVKTLALGFSLAGGLNADRSSGFDYKRFWRQSLCSAVAARLLCDLLETGQNEEAFLAALLSDIGTLVMHRVMGDEYDALLVASKGDQMELVRQSRQKFDLDHAQVGGALAENWNLPPLLIEPIRLHHSLAEIPHATMLVKIVGASVLCGQIFAASRSGLAEQARAELFRLFNLNDTQIQELFDGIVRHTDELAGFFEIDIGPSRTLSDIEAEASQALMDLAFKSQVQSAQAMQQNDILRRAVTTDTLTGLANRSRFDDFLNDTLEQTRRSGRPTALLFMDVDRFKSVNDTFGHQAGDAVLAVLGKLLGAMITSPHLAARYGGEEIAIVLTGTGSQGATRQAEILRRAVQAHRIVFGGRAIPVTVSIGVAATDTAAAIPTPATLIYAADQALYCAKQAGRNRVRSAPDGVRTGVLQ